MLLKVAVLSFLISLILNLLIIKLAVKFSVLNDSHSGPQKVHILTTPRVGGIGIFVGVTTASFILETIPIKFILCIIPIFIIGLYEDIYKRVIPVMRLLVSFLSAGLAVYFMDSVLVRLDISFLDFFLKNRYIAIAFTIFAIAGIVNAINIIDGINGLASGVSIMIFLGLAYVAFIVQDYMILTVSIVTVFCLFGFFVWNYPFGKIFLGDGGAYMLGFMIAILSVLLVSRHSEVSPWFPLLLAIYPFFETIFSMYRRKFVKKCPAMEPDRFHLHTLVYRRVVPHFPGKNRNKVLSNSASAPFLWLLCSFVVFPAMMFWNNTNLLILFSVLFCLLYIYIYRKIVHFKVKKPL